MRQFCEKPDWHLFYQRKSEMKKYWIILLLFSGMSYGQTTPGARFDPGKVCRIEDGQLIFTLNLNWGEKEKKELTELFDLDSLLLSRVYRGETEITAGGENWKVKKRGTGMVELFKPLDGLTEGGTGKPQLFDLMDQWMNFRGEATEEKEVYGVNSFRMVNAFVYAGNLAQFYLPGFEKAKRVFLAGSFNNWNTGATSMRFTGKGWITDVRLAPGKYTYKYVVDGRWTTDPSNLLTERGGAGAPNSVVWCPNHVFRLKGFQNAGKVVITGNFYHWNPRGITMNHLGDRWEVPVWFREGTYVYKFLVDNRWMADPDNPNSKEDAAGNLNSFLEIGEPFLFTLPGFTDARNVVLTGSFNSWDRGELVMYKTSRGWELPYVVPAGNYEYKFIVDGKWMTDPSNPFTSGSGATQNSFIALRANHIFELKDFDAAKNVVVAGSFNGWDPQGYRMARKEDLWIFPVYLSPGKHSYKFIVDGKWILDPANGLFEENQYGTGNSVLWKVQSNK
jgi:hypothetical protein